MSMKFELLKYWKIIIFRALKLSVVFNIYEHDKFHA